MFFLKSLEDSYNFIVGSTSIKIHMKNSLGNMVVPWKKLSHGHGCLGEDSCSPRNKCVQNFFICIMIEVFPTTKL
jgi:hypothetical protein